VEIRSWVSPRSPILRPGRYFRQTLLGFRHCLPGSRRAVLSFQ